MGISRQSNHHIPPPRWQVLFSISCVLPLLFACAGQVPSKEEVRTENKNARVSQILRVAETTRQGGDLASAISLYRRAAAMAPDAAAPQLGLADALVQAQVYPEAVTTYRAAIDRTKAGAPSHIKARYRLGRTLVAMNRPERAIPQFEAVIAADTTHTSALNGLGIALDLLGRHDDAQARYRQGLGLITGSRTKTGISLSNNLGLSLALAGAFDEAIAVLGPLADDPASNARQRLNLALALGLAGRDEEAARVARADLSAEQIKANLTSYAQMRALPATERAAAVFGVISP